ncbi:MAG: aminotransferase class I/II-fold pyridoxal phosphate-dependent enzyme, partial [Mariniphaga sp.]|nr:aminotransferase class I/II-fold pyridoxal phosphate-dependent enzyme [Mariniphaga sp.]
MNPQAEELNQIIRQKSPAVYDMLSERGKNIFFPKKGILGQTAEAKGTRINATIGAAVEDDGTPMRLETIASKINLDPSLVFPYAPSFGRPDLRSKWKSMIYEKNPSLGEKELSLPVVTNALTHGISMAGYLFADAGDEVIVPSLFWGNYNLTLANGYGANLVKFNLFKNNQFDLEAFEAKLNEGGVGKKILILNFPNNPTGYTPTQEEADGIVSIIGKAAEKGNKLVCVTDDAYFGLVYEDGIARESIFAPLANLHENVLAIKLDGATKEDYVWGFRVGFMTYSVKGGDAELYSALEAKTAGAIRGNISNAANISQSLMYAAYNSAEYGVQKRAKYRIMQTRYEAVKEALKEEKYRKYFKALPFNSGYFMCVQLAEGLDSDKVRQVLI